MSPNGGRLAPHHLEGFHTLLHACVALRAQVHAGSIVNNPAAHKPLAMPLKISFLQGARKSLNMHIGSDESEWCNDVIQVLHSPYFTQPRYSVTEQLFSGHRDRI